MSDAHVRALHHPVVEDGETLCDYCADVACSPKVITWPCETIRALNEPAEEVGA